MKREYLILLLIIVLSGAYLLLRKDNRENYTLPEIKQVDTASITGLVIEKNKETIKLSKLSGEDKQWFVTDNKYPADQSAVDDILSTLKDFKLSLLVSQNQDMHRYELEPEKCIKIRALKDGKAVFEFSMGKTAASYNHTYVMLQQGKNTDKNIYQADGNFRSRFDKTAQEFRDKKIMEFDRDSIKKVTIKTSKKGGKTKILTRTEKAKAETKDKFKESEQTKENTKPEIVWLSDDGRAVDRKALDSLLSDLSFLKCEKFLENVSKEELQKQKALYQIILENDAEISLSLFVKNNKKNDDKNNKAESEMDEIKAACSMSPYVFELSSFTGKEIIKNIEAIDF